MRHFQLDQCSNHAAFAEKCNGENRCFVRRLPRQLKDQDDAIVLDSLLARDAPILTMDFAIVYDNPSHIPPRNPGIIVVKARPNKATIMEGMIAAFKKKFPAWADVDWSQLYLEIEEGQIYVSTLVDGNIDGGLSLELAAEDFEERMLTIIGSLRQS
jgi:hypothetical protein